MSDAETGTCRHCGGRIALLNEGGGVYYTWWHVPSYERGCGLVATPMPPGSPGSPPCGMPATGEHLTMRIAGMRCTLPRGHDGVHENWRAGRQRAVWGDGVKA